MQHEKKCNMEFMQDEKSVTCKECNTESCHMKECNMEKVEPGNDATWSKCNAKRV